MNTNTSRSVFAQLINFVLSVSRLDQFFCMAFARLTYRESLRDRAACLRGAKPKRYHMGIRSKVSRNTLAHAIERRDGRIFADFTQVLIKTARQLYAGEDFGLELDQTVYIFDRGYVDFARLYRLHLARAFYVIRAKSNFVFKRLYSRPWKNQPVRADQIITVTGFYTLPRRTMNVIFRLLLGPR